MAFESWAAIRRNPTLLDLAKSKGLNEPELRDRIINEAGGTATFARRTPGSTGGVGDLNLQVDLDLAVSNDLALT